MAPPELILYGRSYCHLCEDMERALRTLPGTGEIGLEAA